MTKQSLSHAWTAFRAVVSVLLLLVVLLPAGVYTALSTPVVQNKLRGLASRELSALTGAPVTIGAVNIHPAVWSLLA